MPENTSSRRTENLLKAQAANVARRAAGIALPQLDPIERAKANPTSLRAAINAKCYDCQGQDCDPGVRQRIRECPVTKCPLHTVRPYQP